MGAGTSPHPMKGGPQLLRVALRMELDFQCRPFQATEHRPQIKPRVCVHATEGEACMGTPAGPPGPPTDTLRP